jgi:hypothetical protein
MSAPSRENTLAASRSLRTWIAASAPLLVAFVVVVLAPRPYFVSTMDIEHDYFYNARLIRDGLPVGSEHHPGTPVYFLSAALLTVAGDGPEAVERFLRLGYLLVALASAASLVVFCRTVLKEASDAAFLLAVALVLAWPTTLTYWSHFGADSFTVPIGLVLAAAFWKALETRGIPSRRWLLAAGFAAGLAVSIKLTFLPLALCLLVAAGAHGVREYRAAKRRTEAPRRRMGALAAVGAAPLGMAFGALLGTLPVLGRWPAILVFSASRADVRPPIGRFLSAVAQLQSVLWGWNPVLVVLEIVVFGLFAVALASAVRGWPASGRDSAARFDFLAGGALIAGLGLVLLYTLACAVWVTPGAEPGIRLRNTAPAGLVLPLMVAYADRIRRAVRPSAGRRTRWVFAAAAGVVVAWGAASFFAARSAFVQEHESRASTTVATLRGLAGSDATLAFWTESDDDHLGEASFHYWGNYRYGHGRYEAELEGAFPKTVFLRLRDIRHESAQGAGAPSRSQSSYGAAGALAWRAMGWWSATFRSTLNPYTDSTVLLAGIPPQTSVLFAFPLGEIPELGKPGWPELRRRIETGFGPARVVDEVIAGVPWRLVYTGPVRLPGERRLVAGS